MNQIEVSHPETLPDLVPLPLPPQLILLPVSGSMVLVVSTQNPPPETYSSSCSLQRFLGWGWGPRGNVSPWGQSHPTASLTPQGPASPLSTICKHLFGRHSKLNSDDTRESAFKIRRLLYKHKAVLSAQKESVFHAVQRPTSSFLPMPAQLSSRQHPPENVCSMLPKASRPPSPPTPEPQSRSGRL